MDDGSERSIPVYNRTCYNGDLILDIITSSTDLLTAVIAIIDRDPSMTLVLMDYDSAAIIYPTRDENNSILFMKIPRINSGGCLVIDEDRRLRRVFGFNFPLVFTHLTELEYTFF
jgi:hypothetical protein